MMACDASMAHAVPAWSVPSRTGSSPGRPNDAVVSAASSAGSSPPGRSAQGPSGPQPEITQTTSWPCDCRSASTSTPYCAARSWSTINTSASPTSVVHWGDGRSRTTERFWRLSASKTTPSPPRWGSRPRARSPPGVSTLTTSAPASTRRRAVMGPATPSASSTTRTPVRGALTGSPPCAPRVRP